jgi:ABC-type antimicrobial peptide transport system permease subunit
MSEPSSLNPASDAAPIHSPVRGLIGHIEAADTTGSDQFSRATILNSENDNGPVPIPWIGRDGQPIEIRVEIPADELSLEPVVIVQGELEPDAPEVSALEFAPAPLPQAEQKIAIEPPWVPEGAGEAPVTVSDIRSPGPAPMRARPWDPPPPPGRSLLWLVTDHVRSLRRTFSTAQRALRRNVLRSALTCLGIIIGIAAVTALMEIGQGASVAMQAAIAKFGANLLWVFPTDASGNGVSLGAGTRITLTPEDCDAINEQCPAVRLAVPNVAARLQLVHAHRNWQPNSMYGTTPDYLEVGNWQLSDGAPFTDHDVQNGGQVCLIGQTLVRELFEGESPLGQTIRVRNTNLKVVGVLAGKGAALTGWDQDDVLVAPWTTVRYRLSNSMLSRTNQSADTSTGSPTAVNTLSNVYPRTSSSPLPTPSAIQIADTPQTVRFENIDQILVSARSRDEIPTAIWQITQLLRERHHLQDGQANDFGVFDVTEFSNVQTSTAKFMSNLLLSVAAISLMVGGVGIMNIMLVSVTERTREIGIRMAVGARARDILRQFLVEAIVLCALGGVIGILFGRGLSILAQAVFHWPIAISVPAIIAALAVSGTVGLIFGWYPAWKASRLDPIEALRYE